MKKRERHQAGSIVEIGNAFHVRYWCDGIKKDGKPGRVQRSERLCAKDTQHYSATCKAVRILRDEAMLKINARQSSAQHDTAVVNFWEGVYLPFAEKNLRHSTVHGYKQIWAQHLETEFADKTMRGYTTGMASRFLTALAEKYSRRTLNHIRSTASAVFTHALNLEYVGANPWHGAKALGKVKESNGTAHYTLEEAEAIINALIDRTDAQLVFALAFFMGLRPSEIGALQWSDYDGAQIHIRRACVRGHVDVCKTAESAASLPVIKPVSDLLAARRATCAKTSEGWMFPAPHHGNRKTGVIDIREFCRAVIRPVLAQKKITWKGLYAGRRGAGTMLVELTGNLVAAQELLRHKSLTTTAMFYKKRTQSALVSGMKLLEAATLEKT
jgi:integrase